MVLEKGKREYRGTKYKTKRRNNNGEERRFCCKG